jgi:hypothetical protein
MLRQSPVCRNLAPGNDQVVTNTNVNYPISCSLFWSRNCYSYHT